MPYCKNKVGIRYSLRENFLLDDVTPGLWAVLLNTKTKEKYFI